MFDRFNLYEKIEFRGKLKSFAKESNGSMIVVAAFALPFAMLMLASAVQYSLISSATGKVQQSTDAALMAGVIDANQSEDLTDALLVKQKIQSNVDNFLLANLADDKAVEIKKGVVEYDPLTKLAKLKVEYSYPDFMPLITGQKKEALYAEAAVYLTPKKKRPISMYLVLDRSGSMDWDGRMVALKKAVKDLTTKMKTDDPDRKYVRMGGIGYNHVNMSTSVKLHWNPKKINKYTQKLEASGGTNSQYAMLEAFNNLKGNQEFLKHDEKNDGNPKRYILFLTDGSNNRSFADFYTLQACNAAKIDGIEIFSVAFQAPLQAQTLLKSCASSPDSYFQADNAQELISSFEIIAEKAAKTLAFSE